MWAFHGRVCKRWDYRSWTPEDENGMSCLLGTKTTYKRKYTVSACMRLPVMTLVLTGIFFGFSITAGLVTTVRISIDPLLFKVAAVRDSITNARKAFISRRIRTRWHAYRIRTAT